MPHFRVFPSQYAPFEVKVNADHWHLLTQADLDLIARLVNGDYSVLSQEDARRGRRGSDSPAVLVKDIDTTAKTLTVEEVRTASRSSARVVASQTNVLVLCG
ncbi:MAG TPA: hypothetical protein VKP65_19255 [Rhodothermales bacterium]|nr:hypothetical protein [Rhodothermales bacterium]